MTEIIPKEAHKTPSWLFFLFYFSLILLVVLVIVYFKINGSIKKNQDSLNGLNNDFLALQSSENLTLKKEVLGYDKKIKDFKNLVGNHKFNSRAFNFLEDFVHPNAWFDSFDLQNEGSKVVISGRAETFEALGQQIIIFQQEQQQIKDLVLEGVSIGKEGEIKFEISFSFNPQILISEP